LQDHKQKEAFVKLMTICGPHGVGKGTVQDILLEQYSIYLHRIVPVTTRKARDGEVHGREYYFICESAYDELLANGQLVYKVQIRSHRSGTTREELARVRGVAFVDITPEGARCLRDYVHQQSGQSLTIFLSASREERRRRIQQVRQPDLTDDQVDRMLDNDPVPTDRALYDDFDLVVDNPDGQLDATLAQIRPVVERFITC
jgi:guanylate kinase